MKFSNVFRSNPIRSFELTVASGDTKAVAFGAGSIINGNVKLFLDKAITIKSIRVVFKCEEWDKKKGPSCTLFSVESCIWSQQEPTESETGNHIYLFAIQLPSSVNFPPTIRDAYLGHRIEYSLQGYLDLLDSTTRSTSIVPLTYLPLVSLDDFTTRHHKKSKTIKIEKGEEYVEVTAKLVNPSSCPGELCSVKLHTHNQSSYNINQVQVFLLSTATSLSSSNREYPDLPVAIGPSYHHKQRQIHSESFYVTIPRYSRDNTTICPFKVPTFCVPTTQCHLGKYIDITYEVVIIIPTMGHSSSESGGTNNLLVNPRAIRLPLIVTTIPYISNLPKLQIPFADENNTDVPTFIKYNESPLPSPGGAWSPGSPIDELDLLFELPHQASSSGHLMPPPTLRRSVSIHSE
ncbi:uncharacterized protein EV154DRAFT_492501 [Mucor mucedo]|uniref:uncharacterized protein n=1 Tax=Mucor mucedo TaxID=29922 RepID=UPI00221ECDAF|nr:uncharacterized protein EV154DRAFT_492501 [Mucor mucedo]KAI7896507.1 hypothetical protein EV154DRAFT_492501 [Mucor mucedo]